MPPRFALRLFGCYITMNYNGSYLLSWQLFLEDATVARVRFKHGLQVLRRLRTVLLARVIHHFLVCLRCQVLLLRGPSHDLRLPILFIVKDLLTGKGLLEMLGLKMVTVGVSKRNLGFWVAETITVMYIVVINAISLLIIMDSWD